MTVSYSQAKVIYQGNGQTTQWDIPFPYIHADDVQVYVVQADGTEQKLSGNFSIDPSLQSLTYPLSGSQIPPLSSGQKLVILRSTPLAQQTEFDAQQSFDPFVLEEGYDKAMMIAQEQAEQLSRAIKFPLSSSASQTDAAGYLQAITDGVSTAQTAASQAQSHAAQSAQSAATASASAQSAAGHAQGAEEAKEEAQTAIATLTQSLATISDSVLSAQTAAATAQQCQTKTQQSAQAAAASAAEAQSMVATHNADTEAHTDIRTKIGTDIAAHNQSTAAHADIRTALSSKAEQTALAAHTARTDNPHAVTKVQVGLGNVDNTADADKPVSAAAQAALDLKANSADVDAEISDINSDISDINAALERKQNDGDFHPEDYGWPDIRPAARPNAIILLAGVKSDYSAYYNLGFAATCEGGYNVFVDGVQYGDTYASGAQCSITWSQYSATAGFSVTQPEVLTAHIVQIVPATYGNTISAYTSARVASSGREEQGVLWCHINSLQAIGLESAFAKYNSVLNKNFTALTCAAESIKVSSFVQMLGQGSDLYSFYSNCTFIPTLDLGGQTMAGVGALNTNGLKKIKIKNGIISQVNALFSNNTALRKIELDEVILRCDAAAAGGYIIDNFLYNAQSLQELPQVDMTDCQRAYPFISNAVSLKDTYLDFGYATQLKRLGIYGTSQYPINGIKQLLVSQKAPFDYASAPQINVSYTGLDQNALVALFNSLPTVTAGQVINITGATGAAALTSEQLAIATDKGWTVTR